MQINSHNLDLLRLPLRDAFAACRSIEAAARLLALFSRYNTGSPTMGVSKALTRMLKLRQTGRAAA
jgi:hypothetical protein